MEIFYINKSEFLSNISMEMLERFSDGRQYSSTEKYLEHLCGLYLVKTIGEKYYQLKDISIEVVNSKPQFKNGQMFFSISHSKDIVIVAFSKSNIGIDVQYMDSRDYSKILNRYGVDIKNPTAEDFFKFWTLYEANIKLNCSSKSRYTTVIGDNYMLTCVSKEVLLSDFKVTKL